jgi:hypothetical protein
MAEGDFLLKLDKLVNWFFLWFIRSLCVTLYGYAISHVWQFPWEWTNWVGLGVAFFAASVIGLTNEIIFNPNFSNPPA